MDSGAVCVRRESISGRADIRARPFTGNRMVGCRSRRETPVASRLSRTGWFCAKARPRRTGGNAMRKPADPLLRRPAQADGGARLQTGGAAPLLRSAIEFVVFATRQRYGRTHLPASPNRRAASFQTPSATILPLSMIAAVSHSRSTTSRTCEVRKMVVPRRTCSSRMSFISRAPTVLTPSNGSSMRKSSGRMNQRSGHGDVFRRIPFEYSPISSRRSPASSNRSEQFTGALYGELARQPDMRPTNSRNSPPVRRSNSSDSSGTRPMRCLISISSAGAWRGRAARCCRRPAG